MIFVRYLILAEVLEVGVEVNEGVLEPSDPHGIFESKYYQELHTKLILIFFIFHNGNLLAHLTKVGSVVVYEGVHDGLEDRFKKRGSYL